MRSCAFVGADGEQCRWPLFRVDSDFCGLHWDFQHRNELEQELLWAIDYNRDASIGDNGEEPCLSIEFHHGRWAVDFTSFYDHSAHAHGASLLEAMHDLRERLTVAPKRELEDRIKRLALDVAILTDLDIVAAEAWIRQHNPKVR